MRRPPTNVRRDRPLPSGPFAPFGASRASYTLVQHWRLVPTPDGPYVLDGIAGERRIASVCVAIDERATLARLAEGWVVLGCRYDANAELPDESEVLRRAAEWIKASKES
jgi:hypothetical protein